MSTAGEAASLFGSADAAGDPFATALVDEPDAGMADSRVGEQPATASNFFESGSGSEVFGQEGYAYGNVTNDYTGYTSWYDTNGQSGYNVTGNATNDHAQHYQANEWYDQYNSQPQAADNLHGHTGK